MRCRPVTAWSGSASSPRVSGCGRVLTSLSCSGFVRFPCSRCWGENHRHTVFGPKINWQTLRRPIVSGMRYIGPEPERTDTWWRTWKMRCSGCTCRWHEHSPIPLSASLSIDTCPNSLLNSAWLTRSWPGGSLRAVDSGGSPDSALSSSSRASDLPRSRAKGHALLQLGTDPAGSMSSSP